MFNFWWSAEQSKQKMLTETQKNEKGQLLMIGRAKSSKNKMFVFGLCSTSDDRPSNLSSLSSKKIKCWPKCPTIQAKNEKGPLSHQKIKCLFLDYIQLLMIGRAIQAKNVDRNAKKQKRPPKSSKNKMFVFGLRSTSDDRPSNLSKKCWPKCKKMKKAP